MNSSERTLGKFCEGFIGNWLRIGVIISSTCDIVVLLSKIVNSYWMPTGLTPPTSLRLFIISCCHCLWSQTPPTAEAKHKCPADDISWQITSIQEKYTKIQTGAKWMGRNGIQSTISWELLLLGVRGETSQNITSWRNRCGGHRHIMDTATNVIKWIWWLGVTTMIMEQPSKSKVEIIIFKMDTATNNAIKWMRLMRGWG